MRTWTPLAGVVTLALALSPLPAHATDVDGPDDCTHPNVDFGDAPEDVLAYPGGVMGHFPTCRAHGAAGNQTLACPPISTPPGTFTGYVRHVHPAADHIWLGCQAGSVQPLGIDTEQDGKVNDTGGAVSACNPAQSVDCVATYGTMSWGQDETYGTNDACLAAPPTMKTCGPGNVNWTISAFSCSPGPHPAFLNILIDFNHDGDWNDNMSCASGCVQEWAVKNIPVTLQPGCNAVFIPTFRVGPTPGPAWMRISLSDNPATDDYPWAGSELMPGLAMSNGETEDYIVTILPSESCISYEDWGDAPENMAAYPGVIGRFPTCSMPSPPGAIDGTCTPISIPPGPPVGYVRHVSTAADQGFWLGCGNASSLGVDSEPDGKVNDTGGPFSLCNPTVPVDVIDFFGMSWGQDEAYGDGDAGLLSPATVFFKTCATPTIDFATFNCGQFALDGFLNICVDMNEDGDWNDSFICDTPAGPQCVYEWAVRNIGFVMAPGCQNHTSPPIAIGDHSGKGWMRITITRNPVPQDFPWNGSVSAPNGFFVGGETEDYPVMIRPANVGVADDPIDRGTLQLARLAPNPALNTVAVRFTLPRASDVSLSAYDLAGRKLADLAEGRMNAGVHQVAWDFRSTRGLEFRAGYYVVRLRVGDRVMSQTGIRVR
jgi:GEVED domain